MTTEFKGTYTAIATPFDEKAENIDFESLDSLFSFQFEAGVNGIVTCGSTAEAASLTDEEIKRLVKYSADKCRGKVPCIGGVVTNNTKRACEMAAYMAEQKLDAVLLVTPPYIKPTQEGIIEHFQAVKSACNLPIIAYNIPGRSACLIQPETIARMNERGLIAGIKDSTGSIEHLLEVVALVGESLDILAGEDTLVYPVMTCGGKGVISAVANVIPEGFVDVTSSALLGNWEEALAAQIKIQKTIKTMFIETNPIPVKSALKLKNIIKHDSMRLPLTKARAETVEKIRALLG